MKKIKNFFEKNVRLFVGILIGGVLVGGSVYAATVIGAGEVSYTNNSQTSVQSALDDLYAKANNMWCKSGYEKQNETSSGYACNKIEYYKNCRNGSDTTIPKSDNTYNSYRSSCIIPDFNGEEIDTSADVAYSGQCRYGSIASVKIPNYSTAIGINQFKGCALLTEIMIPDSVQRIGDSAFQNNTSLEYVAIPDSVTNIGSYAFYYATSLTSVDIPNSVTVIGDGAFSYATSLTSVNIPNSVRYIENYAFYATSLTSVNIPNSVSNIGNGAFYNCSSLSSVTYAGTTYTSKSALISALRANGVYVAPDAFNSTSLSD